METITRSIARLAVNGGKPAVTEPLERFNTIGYEEANAAFNVAYLHQPLSGYLGGELHGGYQVEALEKEWAEKFEVRHAVACNSATSGLLLACMAVGINRDCAVSVSPYTMSASAAAPRFLGADISFGDIESDTFSLNRMDSWVQAQIITNLFGHPAELKQHKAFCDRHEVILIEDNAQAILAKEGDRYAGTVGHVGVFSLNVHKHAQCGEGGICVTNNDELAATMRLGRNHNELAGVQVGLNLRMTEVTAAIARVQLQKVDQIVSERKEIAEAIIDAAKPLFEPPVVRDGCEHSYYMIGWKSSRLERECRTSRARLVEALKAEGIPVKEGYLQPLYHLPAFAKFKSDCPVAERVESELVTYENCAWTPTSQQLKQFREAFERVADAFAS